MPSLLYRRAATLLPTTALAVALLPEPSSAQPATSGLNLTGVTPSSSAPWRSTARERRSFRLIFITSGAQPTASALNYDDFERPDLIRALLEQDMLTLMRFRDRLLFEQQGIFRSLVIYFKIFNTELSKLFLCPTSTLAGFDAALERLARSSVDSGRWTSAGIDILKMLAEIYQNPTSRSPMDPLPFVLSWGQSLKARPC